jgi:hypothetical protein
MRYLRSNNVFLACNDTQGWGITNGRIKHFNIKDNEEMFNQLVKASIESSKEAFENNIPGMMNAESNMNLAIYQIAINDEEIKL